MRRHVPCARHALLAAISAVLMLPAFSVADAQAACKGADTTVRRSNLPQARAAVLCLHNEIRRARRLPLLRGDAELARAATRYSRSMVRGRFFSHVSPAGSTLLGRVRSAGYLDSAVSFSLGENIAWGESYLGTPRAIMRGWMHSPGHRHNILDARFRDLGIGIALGTPAATGGGTYTADFGTRA